MTDPTPTRDEAVLREICEELLDKHHGRQAPGEVDAPSFGRGAAAGWDAAVSAFYKAAVDRVNRATDTEIGGIHRSFASAPAPASGGVDAVAVKSLEWQADPFSEALIADTNGLGRYVIVPYEGQFKVTGGNVRSLKPTVEAAQIKAQADYEQRIRSALSPAATPASEAEPAAKKVWDEESLSWIDPPPKSNCSCRNPMVVCDQFACVCKACGKDAALAKPASSPAGDEGGS